MAVPDNDVILALDVGTGGARAVAYTLDGQLVAESAADYPTYYDHPTWSEQDPDSWWNGALSALEAVGRQLADSEIPHQRHWIDRPIANHRAIRRAGAPAASGHALSG